MTERATAWAVMVRQFYRMEDSRYVGFDDDDVAYDDREKAMEAAYQVYREEGGSRNGRQNGELLCVIGIECPEGRTTTFRRADLVAMFEGWKRQESRDAAQERDYGTSEQEHSDQYHTHASRGTTP